MKTFQTVNGKEIQIVRNGTTSAYKIQFGSGGELPNVLEGSFTNERSAIAAINIYLEKMKSKTKAE